MGNFYFTKTAAKDHRRKGERVVKAKLKNNRTVFKVRKVKK